MSVARAISDSFVCCQQQDMLGKVTPVNKIGVKSCTLHGVEIQSTRLVSQGACEATSK